MAMSTTVKASAVTLLLLTALVTGCATAGPGPAAHPDSPALASGVAAAAGQPSAPLTWNGPRKRVAVARFDAVGSFYAVHGGWDVGGGLAAQLATALSNSGRFIVVERAELASVLREQEMGLAKVVSKETAAPAGEVLGAQLLVRGSVTEFDQRADAGGLRLGVGLPAVSGVLGGQMTHGVVGIDLRLIDTATGQVVQSHHVAVTTARRAVTGDVAFRNVSIGGDAFDSTVLGQATREAIEKAVDFVVRSAQPVPWTGQVVDVAGSRVFVNAGSGAGLKPGDRLALSTVARQLTDPVTGLRLGTIEEPLGEVLVVSTEESYSVARMLTPFETRRGDLVKISSR
jgi:curli biogenesis system outer membrane secretion channel CsgG